MYGARELLAVATEATTFACACLTDGPSSANRRSDVLSMEIVASPTESVGLAETAKGVPTRRVRAASAVWRDVCAERSASSAFCTWMSERSESDRVAVCASTLAPETYI